MIDPGIQILREGGLIPTVARALGITRSAVHQWKKVPAEYLPQIEASTRVPRSKLRPDICPPQPEAEAA